MLSAIPILILSVIYVLAATKQEFNIFLSQNTASFIISATTSIIVAFSTWASIESIVIIGAHRLQHGEVKLLEILFYKNGFLENFIKIGQLLLINYKNTMLFLIICCKIPLVFLSILVAINGPVTLAGVQSSIILNNTDIGNSYQLQLPSLTECINQCNNSYDSYWQLASFQAIANFPTNIINTSDNWTIIIRTDQNFDNSNIYRGTYYNVAKRSMCNSSDPFIGNVSSVVAVNESYIYGSLSLDSFQVNITCTIEHGLVLVDATTSTQIVGDIRRTVVHNANIVGNIITPSDVVYNVGEYVNSDAGQLSILKLIYLYEDSSDSISESIGTILINFYNNLIGYYAERVTAYVAPEFVDGQMWTVGTLSIKFSITDRTVIIVCFALNGLVLLINVCYFILNYTQPQIGSNYIDIVKEPLSFISSRVYMPKSNVINLWSTRTTSQFMSDMVDEPVNFNERRFNYIELK